MADEAPLWEQCKEFSRMAYQLVEKNRDKFPWVNPWEISAFICVNKQKPAGQPCYRLIGEQPVGSSQDSGRYYVSMFKLDWDTISVEEKQSVVANVLSRIDIRQPGLVMPLKST